MAKLGSRPPAPNARTHNGVVSMLSPPPNPAFDTPMNNTPNPARKMPEYSRTAAEIRNLAPKGNASASRPFRPIRPFSPPKTHKLQRTLARLIPPHPVCYQRPRHH